MPQELGPALAVALVILLLLALAGSWWGRLKAERDIGVAVVRAVVQLALVSLIITAVVSRVGWSLVFAAFMFGVAVFTTCRRIGAPRAWPWAAVAMACGIVPVLSTIFLSGAVPFNGPSVVPMAGIVIGGAMTGHSLAGRRVFTALRDEHGLYEAGLSIGLTRAQAIDEVGARHLPEALVPGMDQTRTVGLVTLPGAFVGVLLGGGSPLQAGAAQILVLVGLLAAQTLTIAVARQLIHRGLLLPPDLLESLRP